MPLLVGQKVVYRGTITGLRISAVDGTAFIDNLPYLYQSDFSAGEDGWTAAQGTVAGNIDSIGGIDNWVRLTCGTTSAVYRIKKSTTTVSKGKKYTITFTYYIPSGQSNIDGVRLMFNGGSQGGSSIQSVVDTATTVTVTVTATTTGQIEFWAYDGAETTFADPGGDDVFYIKDIKISEIKPFMDGNHQIEIYDSSNRMLKGVLKAAGTGETLSATELITNGDFETGGTPPSGWAEYGSNTCVQSADPHVGSYCGLWSYNSSVSMGGNPFTAVVGSLYKTSGYLKNVNATGGAIVGALSSQVNNSPITDTVAYHLVELYGTAIVTNQHCQIKVANGSFIGQQIKVDGISVKQVLTPSSSGATVVSSKGGTTYNFSYKNASFTYNAASYYVIIRAIR
jgi:translation elongation factor P/translation initiation factor 5A